MNYPTINMKATGIRLRQLMKQKNLSPKAVQDYLGLSCVQSVYRWMSGCSIPTVDHLYALSALFQIPMDQIIVGNRTDRTLAGQSLFHTRLSAYYRAVRKLRAA
ncbi:MAG: helix-turn-helix transcriptional regulator [bacterium]|nr:helix-turn-helix transcriptional regulator [bacterium]